MNNITDQVNIVALSEHKPNSANTNIQPFKWYQGSEGYDSEVGYHIDGLIPLESFGVIYGPSGAFKSFLALSWGLHIATGLSWSGHEVTKTGVLYIVAEGGVGVPRRIKAWCDHFIDGEAPETFFYIKEPIHVANWPQNMALGETIKEIEEKTNSKIGLVILDTLARCFNGADENSTKDMGDFIAGCDTIKANFGVSVLVVHHSGKSESKAARGSSALRGACDFEYKVKRPSDGGESLILSCEKMKDDEPIKRLGYRLIKKNLFVSKQGRMINSLVLIPDGIEVENEAIEEMKDMGVKNLSKEQILIWQAIRSRADKGELTDKNVIRVDVKAMGGSMNNFARTLDTLINKGVLEDNDGQLSCISLTHN
ncbi:plasmid and phage replicative helicase [Psychromonas ingrahamii 37]|uniref:Plasmid and phage replicative helicase n=2 Tax=Psychromonas ingrahamii TaxID=357794 RepID=A1SXJ3_PSYIN|nr:plasmid and phage replicative helicase [Psychromonas ingrahamii 37]